MAYDDAELSDLDDDNIDDTYLTFVVDGEEYAVHVGGVTEIVRLPKSFAVPDVPAYIRGVINLRGKVIPLLDVRARFGMRETEYTDRTVVVVLEADDSATGLVVDAVSEVVEILPADIDTSTPTDGGARSQLVRGMGKRAERVTFILDVPVLLAMSRTSQRAHSLPAEGATGLKGTPS